MVYIFQAKKFVVPPSGGVTPPEGGTTNFSLIWEVQTTFQAK